MPAPERRRRLIADIIALSHFTHWGRADVLGLGRSEFLIAKKVVSDMVRQKR